MRLEVAPVPELDQRCVYLLQRGGSARPARLRQNLVGSQLQPVLALGACKHIEDRAVELSFLGTDVTKQIAGFGEGVFTHGRGSRRGR